MKSAITSRSIHEAIMMTAMEKKYLPEMLYWATIRPKSLLELDEYGATVLENAIQLELPEVELLLKKGANPNQQNKDGSTVMHLVASLGELDLLKKLVKYGGDVSLKAKASPLQEAKNVLDAALSLPKQYPQKEAIVHFLLANSALLETSIQPLYASLRKIMESGETRIMQLLIENGLEHYQMERLLSEEKCYDQKEIYQLLRGTRLAKQEQEMISETLEATSERVINQDKISTMKRL